MLLLSQKDLLMTHSKPHPFIDKEIYERYGIIKRISLDLDQNPHTMIFGATNSGKTHLTKLLLAHIISSYSPEVYVCTLKDQDYEFLEGKNHYYTYQNYGEGITSFYERFQTRLQKEETIHPRCVLLLDEYNNFINSISDRKIQEKYKEMVSNLVHMARSYCMNVILAAQRVDISVIGTCRESITCRIGLSVLSKQTVEMAFGDFSDTIKEFGGQGDGYLYIEGQMSVPVRILVPSIRQPERLETVIKQAVT